MSEKTADKAPKLVVHFPKFMNGEGRLMRRDAISGEIIPKGSSGTLCNPGEYIRIADSCISLKGIKKDGTLHVDLYAVSQTMVD